MIAAATYTAPAVVPVLYYPCPEDEEILRLCDRSGLPGRAYPAGAARVDVHVRDAAGRVHYRRQVAMVQPGVQCGEPDYCVPLPQAGQASSARSQRA